MSCYWRIRMVAGEYGDLSRKAWDRDEVGIWYGHWTRDHYDAAALISARSKDIAEELNKNPRQTSWLIPESQIDTMKRFLRITPDDWVVVYLPDSREVGLAQTEDGVFTRDDHPLNLPNGEYFKFRKITHKKLFKVDALPDAYQLLASQGRSNVFQFTAMWKHVCLLAEHPDTTSVNLAVRAKPLAELLDLLSASAWESLSYAWLIWEHGFVPTGLSVGMTLPTLDIIGRRRDGSRIVAQCKKHEDAQTIDPAFEILSEGLSTEDSAFYFAYGGCRGNVNPKITVIDRVHILDKWSRSANGVLYWQLLRGEVPKADSIEGNLL